MTLFPRSIVPPHERAQGGAPAAGAGEELLVVTWNVLADRLSDSFPLVPPRDLLWEHRKPAILAQIADLRPFGRLPDVVCLQEVDHFEELAAALGVHGFVGTWAGKGEDRDGVALFHRPTALERVALDEPRAGRLRYVRPTGEAAPQVAICERFRRPGGGTLLVATTHLRAKEGHELERESQARQLCAHLTAVRHASEPLVVVGDFNDTQDSLAVRAMLDSSLGLASAYAEHHARLDAWTTWKIRETEKRRVIDYVFHTRELVPLALLDAPETAEIPPHRLPDRRFPSDHLDLGVRFLVR